MGHRRCGTYLGICPTRGLSNEKGTIAHGTVAPTSLSIKGTAPEIRTRATKSMIQRLLIHRAILGSRRFVRLARGAVIIGQVHLRPSEGVLSGQFPWKGVELIWRVALWM